MSWDKDYTRALMCLSLLVAPSETLMADILGISGPAAKAIRQYLSKEDDCISEVKKHCTLASNTIGVRTFYGKFPDDQSQFAIVFVTTDTGGSGAGLTVLALKDSGRGKFRVVGETATFGDNQRKVRFNKGNVFSYVGTVMAPGDAHCCPTGKQRIELKIEENKIIPTISTAE